MESSRNQSRKNQSGRCKKKKRKEKKNIRSKERKNRGKKEKKEKKKKKERIIKVKKVAEEQKIWNKEKKAAKSKKETKKLVLQKFYKWIYIFRKKASERMLTKKLWDHEIEVKQGFVPKKQKVYSLSKEKRGKMYEFIKEQLRKGYIRLLKSPQIAPVFFVEKEDSKKKIV